nr:ParB N-terminal domain-containing protein [uncultured Dysosmobacter sp.]
MAKNTTTPAPPRATTPDGFKVYCTYDEIVDIDTLKPNPENPNKHSEAQIALLANTITKTGWRNNITVSRRSGLMVKGHARREAAIKAGTKYAPVEFQDYENESTELADLVADNRIAELAVLDEEQITELLARLEANTEGIDPEITGYTAEQIREMVEKAKAKQENAAEKEAARITLQQRFLISPFTIMDARSGFWAERKKAWKALGIRSEIGRGADDDKTERGLTFAKSSQPPAAYNAKNAYEKKVGQKISWDEFTELFPEAMQQGGTSIFDPVLCEVAYRWFCPQGGSVLDPFAGGSVRGIVAALTGRHYTGVDLSARQIEANAENWEEITHESVLGAGGGYDVPAPRWINGDSTHIQELAPGQYDLLFTCPPYADLEVYSDRPEDLSNKDYPEFLALYRDIIAKAAAMLKPDSFACIVVGDIRDPKGFYRNFISDTIAAFQDAGLRLYNEAILIMAFGSLPIRAGKQFTNSRKLGKTHQNILVFCNGDPAQSAAFNQDAPEELEQDNQAFLQAGAGKLGQEHQKVLVFAKGNPEAAADAIGTPESAEDLEDMDNGRLLRELLGDDYPEE